MALDLSPLHRLRRPALAVSAAAAPPPRASKTRSGVSTPARCELCALPLADEHRHVLALQGPQVACACPACALLFDEPRPGMAYRAIPRDTFRLPGFTVTSAQWEGLGIPVNLAFLYRDAAHGALVGAYPSPAGVVTTVPDAAMWRQIATANAPLPTLAPAVEALLVNRLGARDGAPSVAFLAPITECYTLVALVRSAWTGFSGGRAAQLAVRDFFAGLDSRARALPAWREAQHA